MTSSSEHPNAGVISGLRECADWLEQHPELPKAEYAHVSFGYELPVLVARQRLTTLAHALGDRARERHHRGVVNISGQFGKVSVSADAPKSALVNAVPPPEPEPIIPARSEAAA